MEQSDTLYGIQAIAEHLGIQRGQAKHRIASGLIPIFKIGNTVCARRSTLNAWLASLEAAAIAANTDRKASANG